ncbi:GntR family transcriptional regulator, histidine utilization repressor [Salinihabitans flavidus]|uniref:Histidine utilization repressor n=1 Tax=Salinihabitans flavidus TaxID=569882 RepID=A0A1H8UJU5_9RHOB|nr:histidine utilization repressor [Salinihabitans flavidus]SEP03356.1 GntR family transcriptional regulator, histidine utilization repressor [Salinihabitans flavidus]
MHKTEATPEMKTPTRISQIPLSRQIKDFILEGISSGDLSPGDRIPSEAELAKHFSASRMTVNRAVSELTVEGRLSRVQGLGTFVAEFKPLAPLFEVRSIAQEVVEQGKTHSSVLLEAECEPATKQEAGRLEVETGTEIFKLQVLHLSDGRPIQIEVRLVVPKFAPLFLEQDFTTITPSDYLQKNVLFSEVEHKVDAVSAGEEIGQLLEIEKNAPCLRLVRRTWIGNEIITYVQLIHPGEAFRFTGRFTGPQNVKAMPC